MRTLNRILGIALTVWGAIRYVPDLLESAQATAKYGRWIYAHLPLPGSGALAFVILIVGIGLIFSDTVQQKVSELIHRKSRDASMAEEKSDGPDFSMEWMERKEWPHWDLVRMRNIGNASSFNIGLRFSWEELSFSPPFEKNIVHANQEITQEAHFGEKTGPRSSNIGRMDEILRVAYLRDRTPPLQLIASFSDGRVKFEKPFTFELGPGKQNAERIRITPGLRKRI